MPDLETNSDGSPVVNRNGQQYIFDIKHQDFKNISDAAAVKSKEQRKTGATPLNPMIVHQLVIEEDILSCFVKGFLVYQSNFEGIEMGEPFKNLKLTPSFRMDGRDLLIIKIAPIGDNNVKFKPETWNLEFEVVIYDTEDIPTDIIGAKLKKVYFRDLRLQMMSELNMEFSTALLKADSTGTALLQQRPSISNITASGNVTTGIALSALLKQANEFYGYDKISPTDWDEGVGDFFYTSPAQYQVTDDIDYILSNHVSKENNDQCLFITDRYTKDFQLVPLTKIFLKSTSGSKPGEFQIEHFFLQTSSNYGNNDSEPPGLTRAPLSDQLSLDIDSKLGKYGIITQYRFVDMAGNDNAMAVINRPVFSYSHKNKQFYCEYKDHNVTEVKNYFKNNYIEKLYGKDKSPLLTLNENKSKMRNISPIYSTKDVKEQRLNDGRNKTLFAAIYLNECIAFNVLGLTKRTIGRFIGIDKSSVQTLSDFDNKFLGQWFITNVKHVFTRYNYTNEILAVKIHSWQDLKINEAIP